MKAMRKGYIPYAIYEDALEQLHDPCDQGEPEEITITVKRDGFAWPVLFRRVPVLRPSICDGDTPWRWECVTKVEEPK